MEQPTFIDNLGDNTLEEALTQSLSEAQALPAEVRIATGFFSPAGFARIADRLSPIPSVRLMLGVDLSADRPPAVKQLGEATGAFERRRMAMSLRRVDAGLAGESASMPFTRASRAALRKLANALNAGNVEIRRYERAFLHAKAYILGSSDGHDTGSRGTIAGSSNLTVAGLTTNLELNIGRYDLPVVHRSIQWFDDLWADAEPYELAHIFEDPFRPRTPWEIFLRVLWQLYGDQVEEEAREDGDLPLTSFQKHGVARALRLIRDTGGAIVADEVGLGKSFIAGEIVQIYRERRQRALLICPAAVRDAVWRKFLARFQLYVECLSFEQLAADRQLRDARRPNATGEHLQRDLDEYQLVVVDEAHNYRNPDAPTRAAALRRLLYGRRRDVLLLTATPVNNSLWDLYNLVRFFVRQDATFADRGILSIRERFHSAMREDPSNLSPDVLFPVIDATTVKRTRQFVKKHYTGDTIGGPDGQPIPIVFPKPSAITVRYNLDHLLPGFFDRLEEALDPDGANGLTFARYRPAAFLLRPEDDETAHADAAAGLLRSGLLKRFESSARAFGKTTDKMAREHDHFLKALSEGHVVTTAFMRELSADDDAVFEDVLAATSHRADANLYDTARLRAAVERDLELLRKLSTEALAITPDTDPKLRVLADELAAIAHQARREATHAADERDKRKVLVFSFFQDTVEWIREFLRKEVGNREALLPYVDRHVSVSGSDEFSDVSRSRAVHGFAPVSTEAPARQDDAYDLLVATDVLAEGVNLQQCRHIINFDLPWNPMRLVQRHGRIDRIGSPHTEVFLRTVFPADRLDNLLDLEKRILDKLALAAASVGVMSPVEGAAHGSQVFTETRDEIEKLLREDASLYERGGTASSAQTGEEYRQTLRKALAEDRRRILTLPRKVGSGMVAGERRGVFFCACVGERTYLRFVPADDTWTVLGDPIRETGTCLRLIECEQETPVWFPSFLQDRVYDFWEAARNDIRDDWMLQTDPVNLQPRVRPLNLRVAEFIRDHAPAEIAQERLHKALDVLESPWPRREEVMLRGWFEESGPEPASVRTLIDNILQTGLEPVTPPDPLPPIELDDIDLICWMGIDPAGPEALPE